MLFESQNSLSSAAPCGRGDFFRTQVDPEPACIAAIVAVSSFSAVVASLEYHVHIPSSQDPISTDLIEVGLPDSSIVVRRVSIPKYELPKRLP